MKRLLLIFACIATIGCAARIDSTVPAPEIPEMRQVTAELHGVRLSMEPFVDARLPSITDSENKTITQPDGTVSEQVEQALREALENQGITVDSGSSKKLTAEIRRWDAMVSAAASGAIESNATLFVELKDVDNDSVFSGEYHGTRSSTFPIIAKQDVSDSLGLAMAEAIEQVVRDSNLRKYMR